MGKESGLPLLKSLGPEAMGKEVQEFGQQCLSNASFITVWESQKKQNHKGPCSGRCATGSSQRGHLWEQEATAQHGRAARAAQHMPKP